MNLIIIVYSYCKNKAKYNYNLSFIYYKNNYYSLLINNNKK